MARALLIISLAFATFAGCGGGDDGGDRLSQDGFVSQANTICREGAAKINDKAKEVQSKVQQAKSAEEQQKAVADVLEDTAKEYDPYLERLKKLRPPEALSAGWSRFLDGVSQAFDLIPDLADAMRDGDKSKLADLTTKFSQIAGDTRPFAQKYKLDDCLPENSPTS
jgi:hypothetical protein